VVNVRLAAVYVRRSANSQQRLEGSAAQQARPSNQPRSTRHTGPTRSQCKQPWLLTHYVNLSISESFLKLQIVRLMRKSELMLFTTVC